MLQHSNTQLDMAHQARQSSQTIIGLSSIANTQFKNLRAQYLLENIIISAASLSVIATVTFFSISALI